LPGRRVRARSVWRTSPRSWRTSLLGLAVVVIAGGLIGFCLWRYRYLIVHIAELAWQRWTLPDEPQELAQQRCPDAPWLLPTSGTLGVLWNDTRVPPYDPDHPHTGLDIFGEGRENTVPVYAVADGLLTRLPGWKSAVAVQHDDPLRPGEKVWTYYAHMASASGRESYIVEDFPPGSAGVPVKAGQLLGYQGVWSGHPLKPGWMHLHFSVVRAAEDGTFLNETELENTLDPSPYLGIVGNADSDQLSWQPIRCQKERP
jgi:murein DD-endopeptidase MepM/ murein hydrolase activator NlpD